MDRRTKGQLTVLVPQHEVNYRTVGSIPGPGARRMGIPFHMMPRSDGIMRLSRSAVPAEVPTLESFFGLES